MDSGSVPLQLGDPAGALGRLAERGGTEFRALTAARELSAERLLAMKGELAGIECPDGVSVVMFGSWARHELTDASDHDWAVLVESSIVPSDVVESVLAGAHAHLGQGDAKPGATEIFGTSFTCDELVQRIGLEDDSNRNLTRRMLTLLESVAVVGPDAHLRAWDRVLRQYLEPSKDYRPPRFLLNDVVRYWRTMCVDFEGKGRKDPGDDKWVTRNAKLRLSRKVLFAAGLVPVLACSAYSKSDQLPFLTQQLRAAPVDRLAQAFLQLDDSSGVGAGVRGIGAYDRFVELMSSNDVRTELRTLTAQTRHGSDIWAEIDSLGQQLESSLLSLLFGNDLSRVTQEYGIF